MSSNSIKVFAPATIANVGPGFDVMGFALCSPGDEIIIKKTSRKELRITKITGDNGKLPFSIDKNTASFAIKKLIERYNLSPGFDLQVHKKMGIGSGLGSSAASAVAGVFALNKLLNLNLKNAELLEFALQGESIASNALHADNVAPCLYGGFVFIRSYNPIDIIKIKVPTNIYCSVIYPQMVIKTSDARKILPKAVSIKKSSEQVGNAAALVTGLIKADYDLISRSMIDVIAEPHRAKLLPFYDKVRTDAINHGAMSCNISGSGPSMFALSTSKKDATKIAGIMLAGIEEYGFKGKTYISKINRTGPKVLD